MVITDPIAVRYLSLHKAVAHDAPYGTDFVCIRPFDAIVVGVAAEHVLHPSTARAGMMCHTQLTDRASQR